MTRIILKTEIQRPVGEVIKLFKNRTHYPEWQPGLINDEDVQNKKGETQHKLTYRIGRRNMIMTETVLKSNQEEYNTIFEMKGVRNTVRNIFTPVSSQVTLWTHITEFRFRGLMTLIAPFMKSGFEKQSEIIMKNFKNYAERRVK